MTVQKIQKFIILTCGWIILVVGILIMPLPIPMPFPVGVLVALVGCAILTTHSKTFRRFVQRMRHRNSWLSHLMERFTKRAPRHVKHMVVRTRPHAVHRHERIRARRGES